MILLVPALLVAWYGWVVLRRLWAWNQLTPEDHLQGCPLFVTVIVPVRNEEANLPLLLQLLEQQRFPSGQYEVLVADDHSTDGTFEIVKAAMENGPVPVRLISLAERGISGSKKAALAAAIRECRGDVICTTDGDCQVPAGWLQRITAPFARPEVQLVSGPVAYLPALSLIAKLQAVEFAGLIGIGGASMALHRPNMCNGANLAFRREAYEAVEGYEGNAALASGDDEFLLHKIIARYGAGSCVFQKDPAATVTTPPQPAIGPLFRQRIRWASKWPHYTRTGPKLLALLVGSMYAGLLAALILAAAGWVPWTAAAGLWLLKMLIDLPFLVTMLRFFGRQRLWPYALLLEVVYLPFTLAVGIAGLRKSYTWKGRTVR